MKQGDIDNREETFEAEVARRLNLYNDELSGTRAGYMPQTSAGSLDSRPDIRAKKARKEEAQQAQLTALQQLLSDPVYAEAYHNAKSAIADFKERMTERLEQLDEQITALDEKLESLTPGSPEHKRLMRDREALQKKQQDLLDYYNETIRPIEERMDDPDNLPSLEELEELNKRMEQGTHIGLQPDVEEIATPTEVPTASGQDFALPTLNS